MLSVVNTKQHIHFIRLIVAEFYRYEVRGSCRLSIYLFFLIIKSRWCVSVECGPRKKSTFTTVPETRRWVWLNLILLCRQADITDQPILSRRRRQRMDCNSLPSLSTFPLSEDRKGLKQTSFLNDSGKHFFADIVYSQNFVFEEKKKEKKDMTNLVSLDIFSSLILSIVVFLYTRRIPRFWC